jgi:hypothetical protein
MINGAHVVISSTNPEADYSFFRDVLKLPYVNDGGYVIFAAPAAEISMHEARAGGAHELFLQCDDVKAFIAEMEKQGIACSPAKDQGWGLLTQVTLPGEGKLSVYQPRHERPSSKPAKPRRKARAKM